MLHPTSPFTSFVVSYAYLVLTFLQFGSKSSTIESFIYLHAYIAWGDTSNKFIYFTELNHLRTSSILAPVYFWWFLTFLICGINHIGSFLIRLIVFNMIISYSFSKLLMEMSGNPLLVHNSLVSINIWSCDYLQPIYY
jgi:hypothetical protein